MEYYSATERNGIMPFTATWMDPETVTLNEADETQKDKPHMVLLTRGIQNQGTKEPIYKTEIESQE